MSSIGGVATGVFWDIEDCKIPNDLSVVEVSQNIKKTISTVGIKETEVSIRAYGDKKDHDFHSAGIPFTKSPAGERNARQKQILADVLSWAIENPPPANVLLIMGDPSNEFSAVILWLKSLNYRYLLSMPGGPGQP